MMGAVSGLEVAPNSTIIELDARELHALAGLPDDHAAWPIDAIVLSPNALVFIQENGAKVLRTSLRFFGFWDHTVREIVTNMGLVGIDAAGAYRLVARA